MKRVYVYSVENVFAKPQKCKKNLQKWGERASLNGCIALGVAVYCYPEWNEFILDTDWNLS